MLLITAYTMCVLSAAAVTASYLTRIFVNGGIRTYAFRAMSLQLLSISCTLSTFQTQIVDCYFAMFISPDCKFPAETAKIFTVMDPVH